MELLQEYRLGAPTKYAALAEKAATLAESADDWRKARACWDIKTRWHLLEKDRERNLLLMLATETYVKEAEDQENASKPFSCVTCSKLLRHSELFEVPKKKLQMQKPELKKFTNCLQYQEESRNELIEVIIRLISVKW